jgi:hypothetical protein
MLHQLTRELITLPFPVASTLTNFAEGVALNIINQSGVGVLTLTASAASTDKFGGASRSQWNTPTTGIYFDTLTVPSSSPYTATLSNALAGTGTEILLYNTTASAYITPQTAAAPATGYAQVANGSTTVTFNSAQAGATVTVQYRYNLTAAQALALTGNGIPGFSPPQVTGVLDTIRQGIVYTDQFDASKDWTTWAGGSGSVLVGNAGQFTLGATGSNAVVPNAVVVAAPTSTLPFLGLYYNC